jgi:hypothetical protein
VSEIENTCPEMTGTLFLTEPGIPCFEKATEAEGRYGLKNLRENSLFEGCGL